MNGHRLASVFTGLRWGLHALVVVIGAIVILRALAVATPRAWVALAATVLFLVLYAVGSLDGARRSERNATALGERGERGQPGGSGASEWSLTDAAPLGHGARPASAMGRASGTAASPAAIAGVLALLVLWAIAAFCLPEAAYLVFPLFFLMLHLLGTPWGPVAVLVSTVLAIVALGVQQGFSVPAAIGPSLGAAVALLIGLGYRSFTRQAQSQDALLSELMATRDELAISQHLAGVEAERARLARDIHDTVSQSLSSIHMLLHAAERAPDPAAASSHIRLARETAASAQEEARSIVRALTPAQLGDRTLPDALRRLTLTEWAGGTGPVRLRIGELPPLGMSQQTALLRLAQGAVGNALKHSGARSIALTLRASADHVFLEVADDGVGFDPLLAPGPESGPGHFGLSSMHERVQQLGGSLAIESEPGNGTRVVVDLPLNNVSAATAASQEENA